MTDKPHPPRDMRVKPRYKIQVEAKIRAQLIGSSSKFEFVTENISESGLLVSHPPGMRHAFNDKTILEVWLRTSPEQEIFFFAKYVRGASESSFAIRIIDIDPENLEFFQDFISAHMHD